MMHVELVSIIIFAEADAEGIKRAARKARH